MNPEALSPTTRSVLSLVAATPVISLKRDEGSTRADRVFRELLAMSDESLLVCEDGQGVVIVNKSFSRRFLV